MIGKGVQMTLGLFKKAKDVKPKMLGDVAGSVFRNKDFSVKRDPIKELQEFTKTYKPNKTPQNQLGGDYYRKAYKLDD